MEPEYVRTKAAETPRPVEVAAERAMPASLPQLAGNRAVARLLSGAGPALHRKALRSQGAGPLDGDIAAAIDAQRGRGSPLPEAVRGDMEQHLGADLSSVRLHTGAASDTLNRAVQAEAFTTGSDVFVSSDRYNPSSNDGRRLLAHELTHVVQQSTGTVGGEGEVSHPNDPAEIEASKVADAVTVAPRASEPSAGVARAELGEEDEESVQRLARQEGDEDLEEDMG